MSDLAPFELHDTDHGDLFGAFLAVHAMPGAVLLLHTTVGCKFKTQQNLVDHDWARPSHHDRIWTGVDDARLISGSGRRLVEFATTWYERRRPDVFFVATNAAIELSAFDVEAAVEDLRARLPCPVVLLKAPGWAGGLGRGYRRVVEAVAGLIDWRPEPDPASVAIAGYLFDRFEMDHAANLGEVRRLLAAIGAKVPAVLLGGEGLPRLAEAARAASILVLPHAHASLPALAAASGRRCVATDLPVGLHGTSRFLRAAGGAAGVPPEKVEAAIDRELSRAVPTIGRVEGRLRGLAAAVCLDTPLAAAVTAHLAEIGVRVPLVVLTDGGEADETAYRETLARHGCPAAPGRVIAGASHDRTIEAMRETWRAEPFRVAFGSSFQLRAGTGRWGLVQMGYPCAEKHWIYPVPWMGFNGAVALVQRMLDAAGQVA
ncbi:MAG: hypothetical protein FJ087_11960 [Deltaproteobacteria bacterium]|nr:hypothetical protein [Deltaproteobacteria bacterium]